MFDALAIVIPFILVSAFLPKVIDYSTKHKRPTQGWYVALVGGSLALLSMVGVHFFPEYDVNFTLIDYAILLFGAGVLMRPVMMSVENRRMKMPAFQVLLFGFAVALLAFIVPQGFYATQTELTLWAERLGVALSWVVFVNLFTKQTNVAANVTMMSLIIALGLSVIAKGVALFALIIIGCCMGFLRFNRPPAKVTLGFTGSAWLGFILFGLAVIGFIPHPITNPTCLTLLTLFMLPLADGLQAGLISTLKRTSFSNTLWAAKLASSGMTEGRALMHNVTVHFLLFL